MSFRSRKWKRSSFESVAGNIRTPTLTRPKEMVPLQIERMPWAYPARQLTKTAVGEVYDLRSVVLRVQSRRPGEPTQGFSTRAGGSHAKPVGRPASLFLEPVKNL